MRVRRGGGGMYMCVCEGEEGRRRYVHVCV